MIEFANQLLQKWAVITVSVLLLTILLFAPMLHAHDAKLMSQVKASYSNQEAQSTYDSTNQVSNALSQLSVNVGHTMSAARLQTLSSIVKAAAGVTGFDKNIAQSTRTAATLTFMSVRTAANLSFKSIRIGATLTTHTATHEVADSFSLPAHTAGNAVGFLGGIKHVSALIRPSDPTPTPTITQMRAQEATIIQSGTLDVAATPAPAVTTGTGGACDSGEGNGGYPLNWCNAPMDTIATLLFNSDPINRECTSYADWYFTNVEGHTNFQAWGNAKYWATSSNYSTGSIPIVGAIAVETAGAYGHVAIVQALPGQTYAGQVVPADYVLVSEMNYDWHGHFRYSYSPLSKFATYIYP